MKAGRIIGVMLVVLGIVLLYYGYTSTQSPMDNIYKAATGGHTARTERYLIGGAAAVVGGPFVVFGKK